nr:hypothetical protein CFP56_69044 [Quercus suber]
MPASTSPRRLLSLEVYMHSSPSAFPSSMSSDNSGTASLPFSPIQVGANSSRAQQTKRSLTHTTAVYSVIIAWAVTFTIVVAVLLTLGFGPIGVMAGSTAAAFQAWMYGGFTPAAGLFATMTSLAMLGVLQPIVVVFAACIATLVALIVWLVV